MTTTLQPLEHLLNLQDHVLDQGGGYLAQFNVQEKNLSQAHPHGMSFSISLTGPQGRQLMAFKNARSSKPIPAEHFAVRQFDYNPSQRHVQVKGKIRTYSSVAGLLMDFFREIDRTLLMNGRKDNPDRQGQAAIRQHLLRKATQAGAGEKSGIWFSSDAALRSVLTDDACSLLQVVRDHQPGSIAELSKIANQPYERVRRTVAILERYRFIALFCESGYLQPVDNSDWASIGVAHPESR